MKEIAEERLQKLQPVCPMWFMGYLPVSFFLLQSIMPATEAMERSVSCSWNKEQMLMCRQGQAKYHWYTVQHTLVICQW